MRTHGSLGDTAYDQLRAWIAEGSISPGTRFREQELAQRLHTSRTPVREALRRLQAEGVINRDPSGSYSIGAVSLEELAQIYQVRELNEGLAARLAATNRTFAQLGKLADTIDAIDRAYLRSDDADTEIERLAVAFHETIAEASGNPYLRDVLKYIRGLLVRYRPKAGRYAVSHRSVHTHHAEILEALTARDADRSEALVREHIRLALATRITEYKPEATQRRRTPKARAHDGGTKQR